MLGSVLRVPHGILFFFLWLVTEIFQVVSNPC